MTDVSPERVEALAKWQEKQSQALACGVPGQTDFVFIEKYGATANTLRALSAEVARLKAENAAKDAMIVRMREALECARGANEDWLQCCRSSHGLTAPQEERDREAEYEAEMKLREIDEALALTPAALADCVVVPREPTEKMIVAWEGVQVLREDTEWAQQQPAADGWSEADWHFDAACARSNWRAMLEASRER